MSGTSVQTNGQQQHQQSVSPRVEESSDSMSSSDKSAKGKGDVTDMLEEQLEQRLWMVQAERAATLARQARSQQEVQRLKAEISLVKQSTAETQATTDRMRSEVDKLQQVNQTMEQTLDTNLRLEHELRISLADMSAEVEQLRQKNREAELAYDQGPQAELLRQLNARREELAVEIAEQEAKKRERQGPGSHDVSVPGTGAWSCHRTQGDESSARVSDVDEELELQLSLSLDWQTLSQFTSGHPSSNY